LFIYLFIDPVPVKRVDNPFAVQMATSRNYSMSGINSGHHNLPTYEMSLKSDNVEFVRHCGGYFENGDR
jgi:hypothetical protein